MRFSILIALISLALTTASLGCGDNPAETIQAVRYESDHFVVLDFAGTPPALADSFSARLETDYQKVTGFLPDITPPASIRANILPGWDLPSMTLDAPELTQWSRNLAFDYNVHLLIHIFTGYQRSEFLEEGLAVYGTEVLVPTSTTVEPYRAQVPHAWVSLFAIHGTEIPFASLFGASNVVFDPSGSVADALAWQFYVEAGSFTRWVFDTYGAEAWWRLYRDESTEAVLGLDAAGIDRAWIAAVRAQYPNPLSCQVALGRVGPREEVWCAVAEGR